MPVDCQSCLLLNNWSTGPQGNSLTSPSRSGLEISSSAKKMKPFTRYDQYLGIKGSHTNNTSAPELFRNSKVFLAWIPKAEHSLLALQQAGGAWSGAASPASTGAEGGCSVGAPPCPCVGCQEERKERDSAPKCSNSSGVRCGSCLPAQSNSVQPFQRGNEEYCTWPKLQGGF